MKIGSWVQRVTDGGRMLTRAHLVESIIADEPVTRCGRRLTERSGTHFREAPEINHCVYCDGFGFRGPSEDDPTVQHEAVTA